MAEVEALFARLDTAVKNGQTKRGLKAADEILKLAPGDEDALRCKAALLVEAGNHGEALKLVDTPPLAPRMAFEKAYCLYRLGRLPEALAALQQVPAEQEAARLQLEAQIQYRQGNHKAAIELYSRLFRGEGGGCARDVRANVVAAYVAGGRAGEVPAVMQAMKISPKDGFEVAFNAACGLVEAGDLRVAEEQLQLATRVGEEALYDEELGEAEVAAELAPVAAQLGFVAAALGRPDAAAAAYERVLGLGADDATTASVATNNLYAGLLRAAGASTSRRVAGEAVKKLDAFMERSGGLLRLKPGLELRLGAAQREALLASYATAALLATKTGVAKEAIRSMERQLPDSPLTAQLHASLLWQEGKPREADAALAALAAAGGGGGAQAALMRAALMRAQLAAARGDAAAALAHLSSIPDAAWQARPAVLATRLALLEGQGRAEEAAAALAAALQQWQSAPASPQRAAAVSWVLKRLAAQRQRQGELEAAAGHYAQLAALDPEALQDPDVLSGYARLAAVCAPADAVALAAQLPGGGAPLGAAELDALESASIAVTSVRRRAADDAPAAAEGGKVEGGGAPHKKRKRKRQQRLPKGFDPANPGPPPDPERWLPKWQRSDAKKLRKRLKGKDATKGSQGAGKVDESLDRTHAAADDGGGRPKAPPARGGGGKKKGRR